MAQRDYFAVLEIGPDASEAEIRLAYRRLARRYHPDLHPERADAEARLKELNEAYEVLGHPERRARYRASFRLVRVRVTATPGSAARKAARPEPPPYRARQQSADHVDLSGQGYVARGYGAANSSGVRAQPGDPWARAQPRAEADVLLLLYLRRLVRVLGGW